MPQTRTTFGARMKYRFDNFMAAGPKSIFMALIFMFIAAFVMVALLRTGLDFFLVRPGASENLLKDLWTSFMQITDPGAVAEDGESPAIMKVVGILTMFMGLIFFSGVIAFITTELDKKVEELKRGRSVVIEKGHVIILGWGEMVFDIIRELIIANESEKSAAVVVLSELPKEEMDDIIAERIKDRKTTRIITRTGTMSSMESLERVSVTECKSVIVLPLCNASASDEDKLVSDAKVLKSVLAVIAASKEDPTRANIIAEMYDTTKRDVIVNLDPEQITMVETGRIVAKIIVQTSRTPGLGFVYNDIIGYAGSEIYFYKAQWQGCAFGELQFRFKDGMVMGVRQESGVILLNPGSDYSMNESDEVIIIAEDDSSIRLEKKPVYFPVELPLSARKLAKGIESALIIGWNSKAAVLIEEYTEYVLDGSVIDVMIPADEEEGKQVVWELQERFPGIKIGLMALNPLDMNDLRSIDLKKYNTVILLNRQEDDTEKIDSTTITTLLMIREILKNHEKETGVKVKTQVITEVMKSDNLELIVRTGVNDSIISNQMVSKIMAQVAENPGVLKVYEDLFSEEGSEIYLKPVTLYLDALPESAAFADLMRLAQKRGEILLGYRVRELEHSVKENFGVIINPKKNMVINPKDGDQLIVLAENEL
jgi:K+/H+ antiporter YhaU regulatory subunit KhtT